MEKMLDPLRDGEAVPPLIRLSPTFLKGTFGGKPANRCKYIDDFAETLFALTSRRRRRALAQSLAFTPRPLCARWSTSSTELSTS